MLIKRKTTSPSTGTIKIRRKIAEEPTEVEPKEKSLMESLTPQGLAGKTSSFFDSLSKSKLATEYLRPVGELTSTLASAGKGIIGLGKAGVEYLKGDKDKALQTALQAGQPQEVGQYEPFKSSRQAVGAGAEIGFNIAGFGMGKPTSLWNAAKASGAIGAGIGGSQALQADPEQDKTTKELATSMAVQAFVGGAIGMATGAVVFKAGEALEGASKNIYRNILDKTKTTIKKLEKFGKDPSAALEARGMWGTLGSISNQVDDAITVSMQQIDDEIAKVTTKIDPEDVIERAVDVLEKKFPKGYSREQLRKLVENSPIDVLMKGGDVTAAEIRELQKTLYSMSPKNFWIRDKTGVLTQNDTNAAIANSIKNIIQPLSDTVEMFKDSSNLLTARELIRKQLDKSGIEKVISTLGLDDPARVLLGTASGLIPGGGIPESALAAKTAIDLVSGSALIQSGRALTMSTLNKIIETLPKEMVNQINQTGKTIFIDMVNEKISD